MAHRIIFKISKMFRSIAKSMKRRANKTMNSFSKSCSTNFQIVQKNRQNHKTEFSQSKYASFSKSIHQQKQNLQDQSIQSIKQFVKSINKNQTVSVSADQNMAKKIGKSESCQSERTNRSQCSKFSENLKSTRFFKENLSKKQKFQEIQKKLSQIFSKKKQNKEKHTFLNKKSRYRENSEQNQLQKLIIQVKELKDIEDGEQVQKQTIKDITKKIQILEKMIAQKYSESEVLKKQYFHSRSIRKSMNGVKNTFTPNNNLLRKISSFSSMREIPSIYVESLNQYSYKKPNKKVYERNEKKNSKKYLNKQPFPRSSYNRQYLYYGCLPQYSMSKENYPIISNLARQNKGSLYQTDFTSKKADVINPNDLDCTHDKIKMLKISFNPEKNKSRQNELKKVIKLQKDFSKKFKENYTSTKLKKMNKTQFKTSYTNKEVVIENPIKDKQLMNLKYRYKKSMNG